MNKLVSHGAIIFQVPDPLATAHWYRDKLGFDITFEWGDPVNYVVTNREEAVSVHFSRFDHPVERPRGTALYVFVHQVDALYEEFLAKSVEIQSPIADQDYGMREFDIADPDGHVLCFGTHVDRI